MNRKIQLLFITILCYTSVYLEVFGQSTLVLKDNAFVVLSSAIRTDSVFLVVDNPSDGAVTTPGGGNLITKHEKNYLKWNIGNNVGEYKIPFTADTTASNTTQPKIPLSITIDPTDTGDSNGSFKFSSYTDHDGSNKHMVSDYMPTDVENMNNISGNDNSINVVNR